MPFGWKFTLFGWEFMPFQFVTFLVEVYIHTKPQKKRVYPIILSNYYLIIIHLSEFTHESIIIPSFYPKYPSYPSLFPVLGGSFHES